MPGSKYINVWIGGNKVDLFDASRLPCTISYSYEDPENFQSKKSSEALSLVIPATTINDKVANTFHNPGVDDMTPGQQKRSFQHAVIEANGYEIFTGKALLTRAAHNARPLDYEYDFFGNNGDWILPLKEATLYDFLKHINFTFSKANIIASWDFDGTSEALPYVFAPVRYGQPMDTLDEKVDYNMTPMYMKPAISVYWLIYWGFKSLGYRVQSNFMDTPYFRRQVMPWTWGNFLFSEGTRLDNLDFRAKSSQPSIIWNDDYDDYLDCFVDNETTNGAFDNNGVYEYDSANKEMKWNYIPGFNYGTLSAAFHFQAYIDATVAANSEIDARIEWYKNGVLFKQEEFVNIDAPTVGRRDFAGVVDLYATAEVEENDVISAKIFVHAFDSALGRAHISVDVEAFELDYFNIPLGGTINFESYNSLKKHKWLDFLGGVLDLYNISPQTDPINKVVVLEPMHPYSLVSDQSTKTGGYFSGNHLDWDQKQDISKRSELHLFSDAVRELIFRFKDDSNDGILKKVQDRNAVQLGSAKYVFGDRFKAGKKEHTNRFFSPVMHYRPEQWGGLEGGTVPQMICMIPENVSNTSRDEAQNTFAPKIAYYKGNIAERDWVFDGENLTSFPFMFAVNYMAGGSEDPILSYCDEYVVTLDDGLQPIAGLLRRFYLQRMSIMQNGQFYETHFRLNNNDVTNFLHREHISCRGQRWELVEIKGYRPLAEESTAVSLRKHSPITEADFESVYPSQESVASDGITPTEAFDTRYSPLRCLYSDIPTITTR